MLELFLIGLVACVVWVLLVLAWVSPGRADSHQRVQLQAGRGTAHDWVVRKRNDALTCPLCGVKNVRGHSCHVESRWVGKTMRKTVTYPGRRRYYRGRWTKPYTRREEVRVYQGVARDRWGAVWTCDHEHVSTRAAATCASERVRKWQVKADAVPILAKPPPAVQAVPRRLPIADLTAAAWESMKQAHGYRCAYCGEVSAVLQKEHRIPLSRGGSNAAANIVPSCPPCNLRKGSLTDAEFRDRIAAEIERGVPQQRLRVIKLAPEHWRTDSPAPKQRTRKAVPSSGGKRCPACERVLPLAQFGSNASRPGGVHHTCRACAAARVKADRLADPAKERERRKRMRARARQRAWEGAYVAAEKRCPSCGVTKPASEFHRDGGQVDGLQRRCKSCRRGNPGPSDVSVLEQPQTLEFYENPLTGSSVVVPATGTQAEGAEEVGEGVHLGEGVAVAADAAADGQAERGTSGEIETASEFVEVPLDGEDGR